MSPKALHTKIRSSRPWSVEQAGGVIYSNFPIIQTHVLILLNDL